MPRGDESKYTDKQKRKADHIEESHTERGLSKAEAGKRAWATVNATHDGGEKPSGGYGKPENKAPSKKGAQQVAGMKSRSLANRGGPGEPM